MTDKLYAKRIDRLLDDISRLWSAQYATDSQAAYQSLKSETTRIVTDVCCNMLAYGDWRVRTVTNAKARNDLNEDIESSINAIALHANKRIYPALKSLDSSDPIDAIALGKLVFMLYAAVEGAAMFRNLFNAKIAAIGR